MPEKGQNRGKLYAKGTVVRKLFLMEDLLEGRLSGHRTDTASLQTYAVTCKNPSQEHGDSPSILMIFAVSCKNPSQYSDNIQSACAVYSQEEMEQAQRPLMMPKDCFKRVIITKDCPAPHYNESGVLVMGIRDFLLHADSLDW